MKKEQEKKTNERMWDIQLKMNDQIIEAFGTQHNWLTYLSVAVAVFFFICMILCIAVIR